MASSVDCSLTEKALLVFGPIAITPNVTGLTSLNPDGLPSNERSDSATTTLGYG